MDWRPDRLVVAEASELVVERMYSCALLPIAGVGIGEVAMHDNDFACGAGDCFQLRSLVGGFWVCAVYAVRGAAGAAAGDAGHAVRVSKLKVVGGCRGEGDARLLAELKVCVLGGSRRPNVALSLFSPTT